MLLIRTSSYAKAKLTDLLKTLESGQIFCFALFSRDSSAAFLTLRSEFQGRVVELHFTTRATKRHLYHDIFRSEQGLH